MILKELLNYGKEYLKRNNVEDSIILAKMIVEYVFNIKKEQIVLEYERALSVIDIEKYKKILETISKGTPIQYITNKQEFMNLVFYVDENVLIPQPDTEILVEEIINLYSDKECKILDLCTGSGAIGISLAKYIEKSHIVATDISLKALQIAKLNAERNVVQKKIEFIESDMFYKIKYNDFDIIVSNPPYIKTNIIKTLDNQVKQEPSIALDGGEDGLEFYEIIINDAYNYIKNNGKLFLEIGFDQKEDVIKLLKENGNYINIYSKKDLAQNDRIIVSEVRR